MFGTSVDHVANPMGVCVSLGQAQSQLEDNNARADLAVSIVWEGSHETGHNNEIDTHEEQ